jgi:hypothetical protein
MPSTRRVKKRQRTHEAPEESDIRCRVPVGAHDVLNTIDPPIEEDMANIRTLTVASHPFDVRAVFRAHEDARSPSFDIDHPRPPGAHARYLWSVSGPPGLEE